MEETFRNNGHEFVDRIEDATCVLWDLHVRHTDYNWGDIQRLAKSDTKVAVWDEWDRGSLSKDIFPAPLTTQQFYLWGEIKGRAIYFCRLLDKTHELPEKLFPYEKPIFYEEPPLNKDDLFNRRYDVIFIANSAPSREAIGKALKDDKRLKCHVALGEQKIPFNIFVDWHKRGKLFISSSAGGFTDERVQCLFSIAGIIRQRTNQLVKDDFTHLENCLRIDSPPTKKDLDDIYEIVNNKDRLYEIYMNGYNFVKEHYSEQYFAQYYLDTMKKEGII